jgi:hypothetical protein
MKTTNNTETSTAEFSPAPCSRIVFIGGPLDGAEIGMAEWPKESTVPGTEIINKPTGSVYRYHLPSSTPERMAYTYRPSDYANAELRDAAK